MICEFDLCSAACPEWVTCRRMKTCTKCGAAEPPAEFEASNGLKCRACYAEYQIYQKAKRNLKYRKAHKAVYDDYAFWLSIRRANLARTGKGKGFGVQLVHKRKKDPPVEPEAARLYDFFR